MSEEIPMWMKLDLDDYVKNKKIPGHFLMAVLENNLFDAVARADSQSLTSLLSLCKYIYSNLPMSCYGSKQKVRNWLDYQYDMWERMNENKLI